jgi:hypothetical protein
MYHLIFLHKKCRHAGGIFALQLLALVLASLVGDAAAGLAGGLAGSLALAAATVDGAVAQVTGLDGLNMFHNGNLHKIVRLILTYEKTKVNIPKWQLFTVHTDFTNAFSYDKLILTNQLTRKGRP